MTTVAVGGDNDDDENDEDDEDDEDDMTVVGAGE